MSACTSCRYASTTATTRSGSHTDEGEGASAACSDKKSLDSSGEE
jgi:hypothetical protein